MIKLFRNIRKNLLREGKTSNYVKYAIGEIVLVVIGILIALSINNWNESRKASNQEQDYLISLKEEFQYNKSMLQQVMAQNTKYADAALEITEYTGPEEPQISETEFSELFFRMVNSEVQYRPSNGVLDEIISSGKLGIFKNRKLKSLLSSWTGVIYKVRFQESELLKFRSRLIDLSLEYGNTRQSFNDTHVDIPGITPSKFKTGNLPLLQSQEFENNLFAFIGTSRFANDNYYSNLEEIINKMLEIIDSEIK